MIRVGVKVPNDGDLPVRPGLGAMARAAEQAGFASVWTTDHVVQPLTVRSPYPFTSDARPEWTPTAPWFDAIVTLATMAEATEQVELGLAVLVCALRDPVVTAKQLASVDALAGGRLVCGIGAGWMAEEYAALGIDFASRGRRLEEWVEVARAVWTGHPGVVDGSYYRLPVETATFPVPARDVPVLVGGVTPTALRRAGRHDGWVGHVTYPSIDLERLENAVEAVRSSAEACERGRPRITTRVGGSSGRASEIAELLPTLEDIGIDDVIVDVDWSDPDGAAEAGGAYFG